MPNLADSVYWAPPTFTPHNNPLRQEFNILILQMKTARLSCFLKSEHVEHGRAGTGIQAGSRVWALRDLVLLLKRVVTSPLLTEPRVWCLLSSHPC